MGMKNKIRQTSIGFRPSEFDALNKLADELGISVSVIVRRCIGKSLNVVAKELRKEKAEQERLAEFI